MGCLQGILSDHGSTISRIYAHPIASIITVQAIILVVLSRGGAVRDLRRNRNSRGRSGALAKDGSGRDAMPPVSGLIAGAAWRVMRAAARFMPRAAGSRWLAEAASFLFMRGQLRALADAGGRMAVQVLPSGCGAPSSGPVTILRFAGVPSLGVAYLPGLGGGICLAGQQDVASYIRAFEHLHALALTPANSARLLGEMAAG